jgi:hypothetical protein
VSRFFGALVILAVTLILLSNSRYVYRAAERKQDREVRIALVGWRVAQVAVAAAAVYVIVRGVQWLA